MLRHASVWDEVRQEGERNMKLVPLSGSQRGQLQKGEEMRSVPSQGVTFLGAASSTHAHIGSDEPAFLFLIGFWTFF